MNYELDLTHEEAKWTCGQIFKLEVITYLWIWILDSFGIIPTCLSKYFTGSKSNYSKQIYLCYAIYNPQLLYSPRKWIHFKEVKMTIFFTEYQVRITKGPWNINWVKSYPSYRHCYSYMTSKSKDTIIISCKPHYSTTKIQMSEFFFL